MKNAWDRSEESRTRLGQASIFRCGTDWHASRSTSSELGCAKGSDRLTACSGSKEKPRMAFSWASKKRIATRKTAPSPQRRVLPPPSPSPVIRALVFCRRLAGICQGAGLMQPKVLETWQKATILVCGLRSRWNSSRSSVPCKKRMSASQHIRQNLRGLNSSCATHPTK